MLYIYPVRRSSTHDNLKWSLRTLAAHVDGPQDVLVIGDKPDWYTGPYQPNLSTSRDPYVRVGHAWKQAVEYADYEFTWMNDDMFFTGTPRPTEWRQPRVTVTEARDIIKKCRRYDVMKRLDGAIELLSTTPDTTVDYWWESHTPLHVYRPHAQTVLALMDSADVTGQTVAIRTAIATYGRYTGPLLRHDPKHHSSTEASWETPFLSTTPTAWRGTTGQHIRATYTKPSPWESL